MTGSATISILLGSDTPLYGFIGVNVHQKRVWPATFIRAAPLSLPKDDAFVNIIKESVEQEVSATADAIKDLNDAVTSRTGVPICRNVVERNRLGIFGHLNRILVGNLLHLDLSWFRKLYSLEHKSKRTSATSCDFKVLLLHHWPYISNIHLFCSPSLLI
jgi:hypothetical protein